MVTRKNVKVAATYFITVPELYVGTEVKVEEP